MTTTSHPALSPGGEGIGLPRSKLRGMVGSNTRQKFSGVFRVLDNWDFGYLCLFRISSFGLGNSVIREQ